MHRVSGTHSQELRNTSARRQARTWPFEPAGVGGDRQAALGCRNHRLGQFPTSAPVLGVVSSGSLGAESIGDQNSWRAGNRTSRTQSNGPRLPQDRRGHSSAVAASNAGRQAVSMLRILSEADAESEAKIVSYVVAIHTISDPERFWSSAAEAAPNLPSGVSLHSTFPQHDGTRAICLWEADSVDRVRELVDGATGSFSSNEYFEVDAGHAGTRGLPTETSAVG
jgi:hypothetical protein